MRGKFLRQLKQAVSSMYCWISSRRIHWKVWRLVIFYRLFSLRSLSVLVLQWLEKKPIPFTVFLMGLLTSCTKSLGSSCDSFPLVYSGCSHPLSVNTAYQYRSPFSNFSPFLLSLALSLHSQPIRLAFT